MTAMLSKSAKLPLTIILASMLLGALIGLGLSHATSRQFTSSATRYVTTTGARTPDQLVAMNNLLTSRTPSYVGLVTSAGVLQPVIDKLQLNTSVTDLADDVSVEVAPETLLMTITAKDTDPQRAQAIANAVAAQASAYISTVENFGPVGTRVKLVPVNAATSAEAASPNSAINLVVGAGLGGLLSYLACAFLLGRQSKDLVRDEEGSQLALSPQRARRA